MKGIQQGLYTKEFREEAIKMVIDGGMLLPEEASALILVAARLRHIAGTKWGLQQNLKMDRIEEHKKIAA
jgi:hypothetical protein